MATAISWGHATRLPFSDRQEWLALRRKGLGGTDAAAILGVNPYRSALDVYLDKKGLVPELEENAAMEWGKRLEDVIATKFVDDNVVQHDWSGGNKVGFGFYLRSAQEIGGLLQHPQQGGFGFMLATPDYFEPTQSWGLEIKTAGAMMAPQWGDPPSMLNVPEHYRVQCEHYMIVTGAAMWYLAVLIGGRDYRVYEICPNEDRVEKHKAALLRFWNENILADLAPELDASKAADTYLRASHPEATAGMIAGNADDEDDYAKLLLLRDTRDIAAEEYKTAENQMKDRIAKNEGIEFAEGGAVTWRSHERRKTDWQALSRDFLPTLGEKDIDDFTESSVYRRFVIKKG
jgi:predicted phage-related endonuclease